MTETVPVFRTEGHLGGYIIGGDESTVYPQLWDYLSLGIDSMLDLGCGEGIAMKYLRENGVPICYGVDGIPQDDPNIITHDYTLGPIDFKGQTFDLIWCCEFVEHVEERFIPNFLDTFKLGYVVLMTHAAPGQPGWHHVNCQDADYWIEQMDTIGFVLDDEQTQATRDLALEANVPNNHYARSGMVFYNLS